MNLLVDTRILVWLLQDNSRLGPKARNLITDRTNSVAVSYFSLLELKLKALKGKLGFNTDLGDYLDKLHVDLLVPELADITQLAIHNADNKDPFDNLLITTAVRQGWVLVTEDRQILQTRLPQLKLLDGRK